MTDSGIHMSEMDLAELYALLSLYRRTYQEEEKKPLGELLEDIRGLYRKRSNGKEIRDVRNTRGAGRKKVYSEEEDQKIRKIYESCRSMRKTAAEAGCSLGHVQDVIHPKKAERYWMYNDLS